MYNTSSKNRYLLKAGTDHKLLLEESGLADKIKKLLPLNGSDDESDDDSESVPVRKMATKQEVSDIMKSYKSRRSFQPGEFTGKTTENARDFMSTFNNYCKLNNIDDTDALLTFEMCLSGAAKCWFNGLSPESKKDIKQVEKLFKKNFLQNNQWLNTARLENRKLLATESAEKYIADMSELGQIVGVTDSELSKALIRGLPRRHKWNVISHNPSSLSETIQRILLGEATLSADESADINAIGDSTMSTMTKLDEKVDRLEELMRTTLQQQQRPLQYPRTPQYLGPPQYPRPQRYDRPPTVVCRICGLNGHYASNCRRGNNSGQPPRNYGTFQSQRYTSGGNPEQRYNRGYFPTNRGAYNNRFNNNTRDYGRYNYENQGSTNYSAKNGNPPRV